MRSIAMPLFWRHVRLSHLHHIINFNAALKRDPRLREAIHSITLLDDKLAVLPAKYRDQVMRNEEAQPTICWVKHWKALFRYLVVLSQKHRLSTLVLSNEAGMRMMFAPTAGQGGSHSLGEQLRQSNIKIEHLIVSHVNLEFILTRFDVKQLHWSGCDSTIEVGALEVSRGCTLRSKNLEVITFMLGDNFDQKTRLVRNRGDPMWPYLFGVWIEDVCDKLSRWPKVAIKFHQKTQGAKRVVEGKVSDLLGPVEVGDWGTLDDRSHMMAEMEDWAPRGWVEKATGGVKGVFHETGGWSVGTLPANQWCCCQDHRLGRSDEEGDGDEEDDEDYASDPIMNGDWSDDSDRWTPDQYLDFLSGETHHYNQDYLYEYGM